MADLRENIADAAQSGDLGRLRELLDHNRTFASMPDLQGYTPLHYAAYFGHVECARFLIGIGAEVGAVSLDPLRNQPVHAAASSGHEEIVRLLLDAGADPNAEQSGQWTPLLSAAAQGHQAIVTLLLMRGSDPARTSVSGATARSLAEERGFAGIVEALGPA